MTDGLAHLDRLAKRGALWEPPPTHRRRHPILHAIGGLTLAAAVLATLYGVLLATGVT